MKVYNQNKVNAVTKQQAVAVQKISLTEITQSQETVPYLFRQNI